MGRASRRKRERRMWDQRSPEFKAASEQATNVIGLSAWMQGSDKVQRLGPEHRPSWVPDGVKRGCDHLSNEPDVVFSTIKDSDIGLCYPCFEAAMKRDIAADPSRCDQCRNEVPDNYFMRTIHQAGPLIIQGNLCKSCYDEVEALTKPVRIRPVGVAEA